MIEIETIVTAAITALFVQSLPAFWRFCKWVAKPAEPEVKVEFKINDDAFHNVVRHVSETVKAHQPVVKPYPPIHFVTGIQKVEDQTGYTQHVESTLPIRGGKAGRRTPPVFRTAQEQARYEELVKQFNADVENHINSMYRLKAVAELQHSCPEEYQELLKSFTHEEITALVTGYADENLLSRIWPVPLLPDPERRARELLEMEGRIIEQAFARWQEKMASSGVNGDGDEPKPEDKSN